MKPTFWMLIVAVILITAASCKTKAQKDAEDYMSKVEKTVKENSPAKTGRQKGSGTIPAGMENILGEWELIKIVGDQNGNHVMDGEEDKNAITDMKDYLRLNRNGTCEYSIAKMNGSFDIVTKDDGSKRLTMYDGVGAECNHGRYIISVTDKELVINRRMGGSDFEVFKRK
ncbi:MAG TPA: hypothetical protein VF144_07205 [Chitinophagaceae bacterium]